MATWAGDDQEEFKEDLLIHLDFYRDRHNLAWPVVFRLVLEVLAYLMNREEERGKYD